MNDSDIIVGIDLGTTNSEIAAFFDNKVQIIGSGNSKMLPSCVGISKAGDLLIGASARNQQLLYPELTVRSIKRKMGSEEKVTLGDRTFSPPEISAPNPQRIGGMGWKTTRDPCEKSGHLCSGLFFGFPAKRHTPGRRTGGTWKPSGY